MSSVDCFGADYVNAVQPTATHSSASNRVEPDILYWQEPSPHNETGCQVGEVANAAWPPRTKALPKRTLRTETGASKTSRKGRKPQYVQRQVRQRLRSHCCMCDGETGIFRTDEPAGTRGTETAESCLTCHRPRCPNCSQEAIRIKESSPSSRTLQSSLEAEAGRVWFHDAHHR